jgi:hypothetical protein
MRLDVDVTGDCFPLAGFRSVYAGTRTLVQECCIACLFE